MRTFIIATIFAFACFNVHTQHGTLMDDFRECYPTTDKWTKKANLERTARPNETGFSPGKYLYIEFGSIAGFKNHWWQYTPYEVLPLNLISFTGEYTGKANVLHWITAQEVNSSHFDIEKSTDGSVFTKTGTVEATGGNFQNIYSYADVNLVKLVNYYRLKIVDKDASYTYSDMIKLDSNSVFDVTITPNPAATEVINLTLYSVNADPVTVIITTATGRTVYSQQFTSVSGYVIKAINVSQLAKGVYVVRVTNNSQSKIVKFVKK